MRVGPEDVIKKSFKTSLFKRGYDEAEVDAFLEEIVDDLRRREAERDELLAQVRRPRGVQEVEAERVTREREQLDLIKTERQGLVSELGALQARLTSASEEIEQAESRARDAAVAEAAAIERRGEVQIALQEAEAHLARSQAIHEDLRSANDTIVGELRRLRTDAETRAYNVLGRSPQEPVGGPEEDLAVIQEVAVILHEHHVAAGEREAAEKREEADFVLARANSQATELLGAAQDQHDGMVTEATAEYERLITEATAEHERLISEAQEKHQRLLKEGSVQRGRLIAAGAAENERLLGEADQQREEMLSKAAAEADKLREAAKSESDRLVREAEGRRAGILAELQARQTLMEERLAVLDRSQGEYRERLRGLVKAQLDSLDDEGWRGKGTTSRTSGMDRAEGQ